MTAHASLAAFAKHTVGRAARLLGVEIVAAWRLPTLANARRLKVLFSELDITSVIDIGANKGQFRDCLRLEIGFSGSIYSFEPDPNLVATLMQRAASDSKWTVFPVALGAEAGTMDFNLMRDPVYNSFSTPLTDGLGGHERGNSVVKTIKVEVATLEAMAATFPDLRRTYLKLDTQGHDLEVLKGGRALIQQVPALQTEVSVRPLYAGSPSMEASISAFGELGFVIADMFLVSTDGHHRAVEFDCIMVRDERSASSRNGVKI